MSFAVGKALLMSVCLFVCAVAEYPARSFAALGPDGSGSDRNGVSTGTPPVTTHRMRLRITWGGGDARLWRVAIRATDVKFSDPRLLGLTEDAPGALSSSEQSLVIDPELASNYGGIDFSVEGYSNSKLSIELIDAANATKTYLRTLSLDELKAGVINEPFDGLLDRVVVTRAPGDDLELEVDREHFVFSTDEPWQLRVRPRLTAYSSGQKMRLNLRLTRARNDVVVIFRDSREVVFDQWGNAEAVTFDLNAPGEEGVYDLSLSLESPWYQAKWGADRSNRKLQFVVLDESPRGAPSSDESWTELEQAIKLASRSDESERMSWNLFSRSPKVENDNPDTDHFPLSLAPGTWRAIPIHVEEVQRPHRVTIDFSNGQSAFAGFSILQPNEAGELSNFGFNSGVRSADDQPWASAQTGWETDDRHQFLFWANQRQLYLVVANHSVTETLILNRIGIEQGPSRLSDSDVSGKSLIGRGRDRFGFLEMPLIAENFAGEKCRDRDTGQMLDDWVTFYTGVDRMIQYLKSAGYTGAMVAVNGRGGTLFPSDHLRGTPRYDTGIFFSSGQDVEQKDVLEMMCRMFDREGLKVIPMLAFSDPLPELEVAGNTNGARDMKLVDYRGQSGPSGLSFPRYNILSPSVRKAFGQVVEEIANRYAAHESFQGLAILCRGDSSVVLPGRKWGYDVETIGRFYRESLPDEPPPDANTPIRETSRKLLSQHFEAWTQWRCRQVAEAIGDWETTLKSSRSDAQLFLACVELFHLGDLEQSLSPSLHESLRGYDPMLELGWDPALIRDHSSAVLLRPHRIAPFESLSQRRVDIHVGESELWPAFSKDWAECGELFCRRDSWMHLEDLSNRLEGYDGQTDAYRMQAVAPQGASARKQMAESLFAFDSKLFVEGGWTMNADVGTENSAFLNAFRSLPDAPFDDVALENQNRFSPVTVRQYRSSSGIWFGYAVNRSPWACETTIQFAKASNEGIMDALNDQSLEVDADGIMRLTVKPYGLVVFKSRDPGLKALVFHSTIPSESVDRIRQQVSRLQSKLSVASKPVDLGVLVNPDLESSEGWTTSSGERQSFEWVDDASARGGKCLRMASEEPVAWLRSDWFEVPETGRLTVSIFLRVQPDQPQPPIRISIESDEKGVDYYRFGSIGSLARGNRPNPIENSWKQFIVHFDDLPLDPTARLRVGVDLMGAGEIFVDHVELMDRWFDENDLKALTQIIASASAMLSNPETADGARAMVDAYWPRFVDTMFQSASVAKALPDARAMTADRDDEPPENAKDKTGIESYPSHEGFMLRRLRRSSKADNVRQR